MNCIARNRNRTAPGRRANDEIKQEFEAPALRRVQLMICSNGSFQSDGIRRLDSSVARLSGHSRRREEREDASSFPKQSAGPMMCKINANKAKFEAATALFFGGGSRHQVCGPSPDEQGRLSMGNQGNAVLRTLTNSSDFITLRCTPHISHRILIIYNRMSHFPQPKTRRLHVEGLRSV
jgi:hypothetical protein